MGHPPKLHETSRLAEGRGLKSVPALRRKITIALVDCTNIRMEPLDGSHSVYIPLGPVRLEFVDLYS
jgi:hypothetical protein